jgi:hypothetical protein
MKKEIKKNEDNEKKCKCSNYPNGVCEEKPVKSKITKKYQDKSI